MAPLASPVKPEVVVWVILKLMSEQRIRLPLRIPASLKAKLTVLAEREHRSLNKQIEFLLDRCVREDEKVNETGDSTHPKSDRVKRK
jgi:hypothetical protein